MRNRYLSLLDYEIVYEAKQFMKVSVIVPTYNRADLLRETIDSILNQTFKDFELIIVDNYSTDDTEKVIKSYKDKRIRYFKNHNNGIVAVNRNFAIKKSKGEYIALCDDDDLWLPQKLEKQLLEFEKGEQIGLVCTNGFSFDETGEHRKMLKSMSGYFSFEDLLINNTIICPSVMVKKSVLEDVGIFDESREIFTGEDYELWLRIAKKYKIRYLGTPLVKYRTHAGALNKTYLDGDKILKVSKEIYKKLLDKEIIDIELYERLMERLDYKNLVLKLVNNDDAMNLETILKTKMSAFEKYRLAIMYFLFRAGILDTLRHIRRNILHIH